jgi:hypothetical protein
MSSKQMSSKQISTQFEQKKCNFFNTVRGCKNGKDCEFVHVADVADEVATGNKIYGFVENELKKCCPSTSIAKICQKITGMFLDMNTEEKQRLYDDDVYRLERMNDAFCAIKEEKDEDVSQLLKIVNEIEKFKFFLSHVLSFFKDNGRMEEVTAELAYTTNPFVKVGTIKTSVEKKNKYTCTFPGQDQSDFDFYTSLLSDISFQTNLRKGLSAECGRGYFTVKFLEMYNTLSIQAKHRL